MKSHVARMCSSVANGGRDRAHVPTSRFLLQAQVLRASALHASMAKAEIPFMPSGLACVLLDSGWSWGNETLQQCAEWLQDQGVNEKRDLVALAMDDLRGTDQWSDQAA